MKSCVLIAAMLAAAWSAASWAQASTASIQSSAYGPVLEGYRRYESVEPADWRRINQAITPAAKPVPAAASGPGEPKPPAQRPAPGATSHEGHH